MYWVLVWEIGPAMKFSPQDFQVKLIRIKIMCYLNSKRPYMCAIKTEKKSFGIDIMWYRNLRKARNR